MTSLSQSGDISSRGDMRARDIITGIQNNFHLIFQQPFRPPPDLAQLRADYLAYLREKYRCLDMKGLMQVQQVTQQLSLAAVYVPLKARSQQAEAPLRVAGRKLEMDDLAGMRLAGRAAEPQLIEEALRTDPAVVVLGDPGAGKSTLLKILTFALAEQAEGPLPILLPLNAYARHLQQGRHCSLGGYLGRHYAGHQDNLAQIEALFRDALKAGQAVILLDGLDEVQANRAHLVGRVQDFVGEYVGQPVEPTAGETEPSPVAGNRVVVTSRIVGYEEAPLGGRQWRLYTLEDFDRPDIEQFIEQWTTAFAISVQGDTAPAREAAEREKEELAQAIFSRPSVERMATNPLLLTILALIKYTGVSLPEQRIKLYKLYLEALIESWNRARSLDQHQVGPDMSYEDTVQVLAPLALWLRQENPTAGLVSRNQLKGWLTGYYMDYWDYPRGQAGQEGRAFLDSVEQYSNLLLERGENQYGFLHLTLEETLAGMGIAQLTEDLAEAVAIFEKYLPDQKRWHETLQLAIGTIGILQQRPRVAGKILVRLMDVEMEDQGRPVIFAGEAALDAGQSGIDPPSVRRIKAALVETMQSTECRIHIRRDAGDLLGRLDWTPEPAPDDRLVGPNPTGLDAFRRVDMEGSVIWMGKYPVTNRQFARFVDDKGYHRPEFWSEAGWAWRTGQYDSQANEWLQDWLKNRPPEKRDRPYWWTDSPWNSPLFPVVGVSWFEAEAYGRWLTRQAALEEGYVIRLPDEQEWEAAVGGRGEYPWGDEFDPFRLNSSESWRDFDGQKTTTAVTTYPQGESRTGVWDGSGNVWEWMINLYSSGSDRKTLRGGSWGFNQRSARVSFRIPTRPDVFSNYDGLRLVVAPV